MFSEGNKQHTLRRVEAKTCDQCGREFTAISVRRRCSDECVLLAKRKWRVAYYRKIHCPSMIQERTEYLRKWRAANPDKIQALTRKDTERRSNALLNIKFISLQIQLERALNQCPKQSS